MQVPAASTAAILASAFLLSGYGGQEPAPEQAAPLKELSTVWVPIPDNPDFADYADVGSVELRIRDFYPRKLARDIYIQPKGGGKTQQPKQDFGKGKTLWDIDALALCTGSARQKVKVDVVINTDKDVHFQPILINGNPGSPIGAAGNADARAFSNATLPAQTSTGVWTASFWVLCDAKASDRLSKFNIALEVQDSDQPGYSLPLIVDPSIRNRG